MTVPPCQTGPRGTRALPPAGTRKLGLLTHGSKVRKREQLTSAMSAERPLGILPPPPTKPTSRGCGVSYRAAQLEGSLGPRMEAAEALAEAGVSGQRVASGQTALEGAPASP